MQTTDRIFDTLRDTQRVYISMRTHFKIREDLIGRDGLTPIYLHITAAGSRERINTEIRVAPKNWNKTLEKANPIDKEHQDINLMLDNIRAKLTTIKTTYRLSDLVLSAKKVRNELSADMPRVNFVAFMTHCIEEDKPLLKIGTYNRNVSILNKLKSFSPDILFSEINEDLFKKYRIYLKKNIGNKDTTINSNIKVIKKYLRRAVKNYGIKIPVDLDDVVSGNTNGNRTCLNPTEVKLLIDHYYNAPMQRRNKLALGYFLFACMCGLRISDVQSLTRNSFLGDESAFVSIKTSVGQIVRLNDTALKIINHMDDLFVEHIERNTINRWMQDIADSLGIMKHVNYHVARHTFATNFLRSGGSIHNLMKLLGHKKIETTMIYVHILAEEANKEITLLDTMFGD